MTFVQKPTDGTPLPQIEWPYSQAPALSTQVGGDHYKTLPIQPVQFIHANGLPFIEGNVVKYVTRHRSKNGATDIRKAIHFCQILLKLEYGED